MTASVAIFYKQQWSYTTRKCTKQPSEKSFS